MEHTVLDKDTIKNLIMPCLSVAKRGYASKFDLVEIIQAIIYKLKSGSDAGFDGKEYRRALESHGVFANVCPNRRNGEPTEDYLFDPVLYSGRWVVERTNAWMDGFRSIMNRFDTTVSSWKSTLSCMFKQKFPITVARSADEFFA